MNWMICESRGIRESDVPERVRALPTVKRLGVGNAGDKDLLACIVSGNRHVNRLDLSRGLIQSYSLADLGRMDPEVLAQAPGMTELQAVRLAAAFELGRRSCHQTDTPPHCKTPADVLHLLAGPRAVLQKETFWTIMIDRKHHARPVEVSTGLLDVTLVHPREIFRTAIEHNAAVILLAHFHPSGDPTPSTEDIRITRRLIEAGKIIDIEILDHVIVTRGDAFHSMREEGIVKFN